MGVQGGRAGRRMGQVANDARLAPSPPPDASAARVCAGQAPAKPPQCAPRAGPKPSSRRRAGERAEQPVTGMIILPSKIPNII